MPTRIYRRFLLSLLLVTWGTTASVANSPKGTTGERITESASVPVSFEDYRQECVQRATGQRLPQDVVQDLCSCTIKKFQSQYTFAEFRSLVQQSQKDRAAAQKLTAVGEACLDEVLYE